MSGIECWTPVLWAGDASPQGLVDQAMRFEGEGWDGITCPDTQCLMPDVFVILTMIAMRTSRIKMGTGVTIPLTRHPAVTAGAIAAVQAISKGRAVLGIGRGDTALAYLGASPVRLETFENFVALTSQYLAGEVLPLADVVPTSKGAVAGFETLAVGKAPPGSQLLWLDRTLPKVPVEVTATGPKALGMAGRLGDRVALNVGVEPQRVKWAIDIVRQAAEAAGRDPGSIGFSLYTSVAPADNKNAARMRELVQPFVMSSSRFAVMDRKIVGQVSEHTQHVLNSLIDSYDINQHVRKDQTHDIDDEFLDSHAIVGPAAQCVDRLLELASLGIDRFMLTYATPDTPEYDDVRRSLVDLVFPGLRQTTH